MYSILSNQLYRKLKKIYLMVIISSNYFFSGNTIVKENFIEKPLQPIHTYKNISPQLNLSNIKDLDKKIDFTKGPNNLIWTIMKQYKFRFFGLAIVSLDKVFIIYTLNYIFTFIKVNLFLGDIDIIKTNNDYKDERGLTIKNAQYIIAESYIRPYIIKQSPQSDKFTQINNLIIINQTDIEAIMNLINKANLQKINCLNDYPKLQQFLINIYTQFNILYKRFFYVQEYKENMNTLREYVNGKQKIGDFIGAEDPTNKKKYSFFAITDYASCENILNNNDKLIESIMIFSIISLGFSIINILYCKNFFHETQKLEIKKVLNKLLYNQKYYNNSNKSTTELINNTNLIINNIIKIIIYHIKNFVPLLIYFISIIIPSILDCVNKTKEFLKTKSNPESIEFLLLEIEFIKSIVNILITLTAVIAISWSLYKKIKPYISLFKEGYLAENDFNNKFFNTLQGLQVIKTSGSENYYFNKNNKLEDLYLTKNNNNKQNLNNNILSTTLKISIFCLMTFIIIFIGAVFALSENDLENSDKIKIGLNFFAQDISSSLALLKFFFLTFMIKIYLNNFANIIYKYFELENGFHGINLNKIKEIPYKNLKMTGAIDIKNLNIIRGEKTILKDINLQINEGEFVILIGASGSGKSTLLNVLSRSLETPDDMVFFKGIENEQENYYDLNKLNDKDCTDNILYQPQFPHIFDDSLKNNLSLGNEINDETIVEYLKEAALTGILNNLNNNLNYQFVNNGNILSGGQKQRFSISRLLIKPNAAIILTDEFNTGLDAKTTEEVTDTLLKITKNKTTIMVTHDLKLLKIITDYYKNNPNKLKIVFLENGEIKEVGDFPTILKNKSYTYNMIKSEFNKNETAK